MTNALFIIRTMSRHLSRALEAAVAALVCTAYDVVLEPFATHAKGYWIWSAGEPPLQNYLAWFVVSALMVWLFAPTDATRSQRDRRPFWILGLTLLIFAVGR